MSVELQKFLDKNIRFVNEGCYNASFVTGHWNKDYKPMSEQEHEEVPQESYEKHYVITEKERDVIIGLYETLELPYPVVKGLIAKMRNLPTV
jgi:hypothetical protein